jgi:hypothetical protein
MRNGFFRRGLSGGLLAASLALGCGACSTASLYGEGRVFDVTRIREGMNKSDVIFVMGTNYKDVTPKGLQGEDMGITVWEYPDGRVYFQLDAVYKVVPRAP